MNEEISQLINYDGPDRIVHFTDFLLARAASTSVKRFFSGFSQFDKAIDGLETGEVVVVSGYTKAGKTLFAESWIYGMTKQESNAKAAIFSFEVPTENLLVKYMQTETSPIYVPMELKTMDFEWLRRKCAEAKFKFNCRIVLIDHLHFLVDMMTAQNMSLNIGAFMRRLKKDIAIDLNLAVILIAHQGQPKDGREAGISTIRDSSFVGQESDATVIVSRRENLNAVELKDIEIKYGDEKLSLLLPPNDASPDDKFSANLAMVKLACHRRTGAFEWKKLFRKVRNFLEEV